LVFAWKEAGQIGAEGRRVVTVKDATERYLQDAAARLKPSTVDLYKRGLKHLGEWCEAEKVRTVTDLSIEKLRKYRGELDLPAGYLRPPD
jgi:site-specific recombinase XerD